MSASVVPSAGLAPSERVLLDPEAWGPSNGGGGVPMLRTPGRFVESAPVAKAMWSAALLANEAAGAVRLEMGVRKALFGFVKKPELQIHPAGPVPAWPAGSLEAALAARVALRAAKRRHDARGLFADEIAQDTSPQLETALRATRALVARGLAREVTTEKTTLRIFTTKVVHHELTPEGERAFGEHAPSSVKALLAQCESARPEIWAALADAVAHVLASKTIDSSDAGDWPDND